MQKNLEREALGKGMGTEGEGLAEQDRYKDEEDVILFLQKRR